MSKIIQILRAKGDSILRLSPIFAFIAPVLILYGLYPKSFEGGTPPSWDGWWQGRFFYIFFLWLASLEIILSWEHLQTTEIKKGKFVRKLVFLTALALPTLYVLAANFLGVNDMIVNTSSSMIKSVAGQIGLLKPNLIPLATEYIVFAVLFCLIIFLTYGIMWLTDFSMPIFLLGITGLLYIIDDLYPAGRFMPLQMFVLPTATLAAMVLNIMGYTIIGATQIANSVYGSIFNLRIRDPISGREQGFAIAWPCAGVESLFIYTITIILFLRRIDVAWWKKVVYFIIGAIVTYVINILRIVTIFLVAINGGNWMIFHNIYGPLYSITWISLYPLLVIMAQTLWRKIKAR